MTKDCTTFRYKGEPPEKGAHCAYCDIINKVFDKWAPEDPLSAAPPWRYDVDAALKEIGKILADFGDGEVFPAVWSTEPDETDALHGEHVNDPGLWVMRTSWGTMFWFHKKLVRWATLNLEVKP